MGFSIWQSNVARKKSAKAQKINNFLQKTFTQAPFEEKGQNLKFAEVLNTASKRVETELADEPEVKTQVLGTLSQTYGESDYRTIETSKYLAQLTKKRS